MSEQCPPEHVAASGETHSQPLHQSPKRKAWIRVCDVLGRVLLVASLLYSFGWGLLSLVRLALRALGGSTANARQLTHAIQRTLSRGRVILPVALVGIVLTIAAAVGRFVAWRTAARARGTNKLSGPSRGQALNDNTS